MGPSNKRGLTLFRKGPTAAIIKRRIYNDPHFFEI